MHTSNQGFVHTFELVQCIFVYVPYYECSLPTVPFPFFPSLVPCQKQSVVLVAHPSPLLSKSVHSLPSSSLPFVPCPLFLVFDYVPALFPY